MSLVLVKEESRDKAYQHLAECNADIERSCRLDDERHDVAESADDCARYRPENV